MSKKLQLHLCSSEKCAEQMAYLGYTATAMVGGFSQYIFTDLKPMVSFNELIMWPRRDAHPDIVVSVAAAISSGWCPEDRGKPCPLYRLPAMLKLLESSREAVSSEGPSIKVFDWSADECKKFRELGDVIDWYRLNGINDEEIKSRIKKFIKYNSEEYYPGNCSGPESITPQHVSAIGESLLSRKNHQPPAWLSALKPGNIKNLMERLVAGESVSVRQVTQICNGRQLSKIKQDVEVWKSSSEKTKVLEMLRKVKE
ncbi:MAG TPA: hypothetical protein VEK08_07165 [Planctomycetota bacterium]|nr:hypothetical protein [Planctomycetota bacterium]